MASQPSSARRYLTGRVAELGLVLAGFFAIVIIVAGGSSVAPLLWPHNSGRYFSWNLGPAPVAALVGGLYFASVIVFAAAATRPRQEARSLTFGVLGLALPTLLFTAVERNVFDWTRPQAVAWVILFCSAPPRHCQRPADPDAARPLTEGAGCGQRHRRRCLAWRRRFGRGIVGRRLS